MAIGKILYKSFVAVLLEQQSVGLWEMVARNNLPSFSKPNPKAKTSQENDSQSYLKEDRDLLGRFLIVSRSSRSIDEQESIGHYEFASYPRICSRATLLLCTDKSEVGRALHAESQNVFHIMTNTIDPSTNDESVEGWSSENDSASQESSDSDDIQRDCMQGSADDSPRRSGHANGHGRR